MAEGLICKSFLAEWVGDAARPAECAAKLRHCQRIAAKRKVPKYWHGIAVLVIIANAPIPGPQPLLLRHRPTMQRISNVCNLVGLTPSATTDLGRKRNLRLEREADARSATG